METYIYTLSDSDGIKYLGKSDYPDKRLKIHLKECKKKRTRKEKWIKNLLDEGKKPILEIIDIVDSSNWSFFESYWISQLKTWGFCLLNGTDGGEGSNGFKGKKHTEETKNKLKGSSKKGTLTEEGRKKISESNRKRTVSDLTKKKISEKAKQRYAEHGRISKEKYQIL
jgi:hypothetical protein